MNRKAQLQMTETIAVLVIFFILVVFGIVFYYRYQQIAMKERAEELVAAKAIDTAVKTLFLPELICTKGNAEPEDNCFDILKMRSANATFQRHGNNYYFDIFSYSRIAVMQVYPIEHEYVLYDKPKPGWKIKEPTYFVISLRDDARGEDTAAYGLGYLTVEVYS